MTFRQSLYKSDSLLYQITLHYVNQVPKRKFKPVSTKITGQQAMVQSGRPPITVNDMLLTLGR